MTKPRYLDRGMALVFDRMLEGARTGHSELYRPDGSQRGGGMHRCAFWAGYNGERPKWVIPGTLGWACFQAGRAFARESRHVSPSTAPRAPRRPYEQR